MGAANKCQVTLGANTMTIEREPIANNVPEVIAYADIVSVVPVSFQSQASIPAVDQENWMYRFPTMTEIAINLSNGDTVILELQEITNQGTWNLGTQAAQTTAVAAINAVL